MLGQTVAVFFVLALLAAFLWALRRKGFAKLNVPLTGRAGRHKLMQVMERVPLTANHSLHLVRVQDRVLLIGVSPSGCNQLESFSHAAFTPAEGGHA
jgi:flagellar biosynthetic protein FliO